jgi:hypothetical protein
VTDRNCLKEKDMCLLVPIAALAAAARLGEHAEFTRQLFSGSPDAVA